MEIFLTKLDACFQNKRQKRFSWKTLNHNFCEVIMFDEKNCQNTLMSIEIHLIKHPFVIYAGFGTFSDKPNGCDNNSQKSFTTEASKHNLVVLQCQLNMQFMMIEELTKDFITVLMTVLINSA